MQKGFKADIAIILVTAFFSVFGSFTGLGLSSLNTFERILTPGGVPGWHQDEWVSDKLNFTFPQLSAKGNRLLLNFETVRGSRFSEVAFDRQVCGEAAQPLVVNPGSLNAMVSMSGKCNPRTMSFKGSQTFKASTNDTRNLVAKLKSAQVRSRLFLPIVSPLIILFSSMLLFSISVLVIQFFKKSRYNLVGCFIPLLIIPVLSGAYIKDWMNLAILGTSLLLVGIGMTLCHRHKGDGRNREDSGLWIYLLAAAITILAAAIRLYGLNFGLPGKYHTDETPKVNAIMRMIQSGTLNPKYFLHPSILLYSTYFYSKILTFIGLDAAFTPARNYDSLLRFSGRLVSATAGTASVFITFLIGKRLYTPFVGLLGALLLAVFPLHVTCSRYLKEDALLTFWVLLAVYFMTMLLTLNERDKNRTKKEILLIAAGFLCAGFSASTKYSGILSSAIILGIPWLKTRSLIPDFKLLKFVILLFPLVLLAFFIGTPYSVFDYPTFIKGFNSERDHMIRGHIIPISSWSQYWMYHLGRSIIPGASSIVTAFALLGVGIAAYRRRYQDLYLVALVLLFYLPAEFVKAKPAPQPERYILPCLPFLALLAAEAVRVIANTKLRIWVPAISLLLFVFPALQTYKYSSEILSDTREKMSEWMINNIPRGSKVLVDWTPYSAFFYHNEFQLGTFPPGKMVLYLAKDRLKESGYDYLLLSSLSYDRYFSQPEAEPARRSIIRKVFNEVPILKEVTSKYGTYGFHNPKLVLFSIKDLKAVQNINK